MNIHKNLRYLLIGGFALTSLVSYSNDTRKTLEEQKAKLEAKLKTLQEENPGINIKKPGFFTKIGHVAGLSLLGGIYSYTTAEVPVKVFSFVEEEPKHFSLSQHAILHIGEKLEEKYDSGSPTVKAAATVLKVFVHSISYIPAAVAVVYDIPKSLTHTRFTEGHVDKELKEYHDSRSTIRNIIKWISINGLINYLDNDISKRWFGKKVEEKIYSNM